MAQLVERDLAKVEAAGSSPVSRSLLHEKRTSGGCPFFMQSRHIRALKVRGLRSAPVVAKQAPPEHGNVLRSVAQRNDIPRY